MKSITKNKIILNFRKCLAVIGFYWILIIACTEPTSENWLYNSFGFVGFYGINLLIPAVMLILGGVYDKSGVFDNEDESDR